MLLHSILICGLILNAIPLPGTQPLELSTPLRPISSCSGCHANISGDDAFATWEGSMMANAFRDPLFQAALTVANQDVPGSGEYCLRCHTPRAWLGGRSTPTDGSALLADDKHGVDCDFCHRLTPDTNGRFLVGNSQYFVADDSAVRGTNPDHSAVHSVEVVSYVGESELCAPCHDVSNPTLNNFPIERTYTEWKMSAYPQEGVSCQSCHFPQTRGHASSFGNTPERVINRHELAGGNYWIPRVLAQTHPEVASPESFARAATAAERLLGEESATITVGAVGGTPGEALTFTVRVENKTGHKLPTGYPEGRRCWLEVTVSDATGRPLLHSGAYDPNTGERSQDAQLRTYEVRLGVDGVAGFHFMLQNQRLLDNRIPPRGFVSNSETAPVGRTYPRLSDGTLAHWDDAPYTVGVPADATFPLTVRAQLWYQTTSKPYVEALRDLNTTDTRGDTLYALWEANGRAAPVSMGVTTGTLPRRSDDVSGGCSNASGAIPWWTLVGLGWRRFRRRSPRRLS